MLLIVHYVEQDVIFMWLSCSGLKNRKKPENLFLKTITHIEVQMYLFGINGLNKFGNSPPANSSPAERCFKQFC